MGRGEEKAGAGRKTGGPLNPGSLRPWAAGKRSIWAVAGSVLLALVVIPTGLVLSRRGGDGRALQDRVSAYQAREQDQPAAARHADLQLKIDELTELTTAAHFGRLPAENQEYVRGRLRELSAYRDYERKLDAIPDPKDARRDDELTEIKASLGQLSVPAEYLLEWGATEAYRRHAERLKDAEALEAAVARTEQRYQAVVHDGEQVLDNAAGANLPRRAREVLDRGRELPDPERDGGRPIPGSRRITYAAVFRFPRVAEFAGRVWPRVKKELEPLAELGKS